MHFASISIQIAIWSSNNSIRSNPPNPIHHIQLKPIHFNSIQIKSSHMNSCELNASRYHFNEIEFKCNSIQVNAIPIQYNSMESHADQFNPIRCSPIQTMQSKPIQRMSSQFILAQVATRQAKSRIFDYFQLQFIEITIKSNPYQWNSIPNQFNSNPIQLDSITIPFNTTLCTSYPIKVQSNRIQSIKPNSVQFKLPQSNATQVKSNQVEF